MALFGTDLNAAGIEHHCGLRLRHALRRQRRLPPYASAAAIILFAIVLTITCINLLVSKNTFITEEAGFMDNQTDFEKLN